MRVLTSAKRNLAIEFWLLMLAAVLVQAGLVFIGLHGLGKPMGDVEFVYDPWMKSLFAGSAWFGISAPWIYPYLALVPMLLAKLFVTSDYQSGWVLMAGLLNLVAVGTLARWGRSGATDRRFLTAAWYFLVFEALIGPVAISRLDGISVALVLMAVPAILSQRIAASSIWLTLAVWVKVWPVALMMALFAAVKNKARVITWLAGSSAALVVVALLLGANSNLFSFAAQQSERGLQIESVVANFYMWQSVFHVYNTGAYYDQTYLTFQVVGVGTQLVSHLMSFAMLIAVAITMYLGLRASRIGKADYAAVFTTTALTATLDLIVFNKVGSPQYIEWLVVPAILAICFKLESWQLPITVILALAAFTQLVYPLFYDRILIADAVGVSVLTARNVLLVALLVWANLRLTALGSKKLSITK
jgi:uncharacterized membrane protein